jgi:hypothetical protein
MRTRTTAAALSAALLAMLTAVPAGGAASASSGGGPVAHSAAAVVSKCTRFPHPAMPPSTGTQTPSGFTVEMPGAVLAPASAAPTLAEAYTEFNDMTCTLYSHVYQESPPDFYYYDCVGFTGYTTRMSDPVAWQSVTASVGIHKVGVVPSPLLFEQFLNSLAADPQPGWQSVASASAIRPGDVLAWQPANPDGSPDTSGVGHSVMPLVAPQPIPGSNNQRWEVVIMDSTAGGHGPDDTRKPSDPLSQRNAPLTTVSGAVEPSGLGIGTIAFDTTPAGQVTGIEWNVGDAPEHIVFGAGTPVAAVPPGPTPPFSSAGYDLAAPTGEVTSLGDALNYGPTTTAPLARPVVGLVPTIDGNGYWESAADGGVFAYGSAPFRGSMGGSALAAPIVGMAGDVTGGGYWQVAADGGVFAFGDAPYLGSMGGKALNAPIVSIAATADGGGYWLVAADGGVFAFGDATFDGSTGGTVLEAPMVGMAAMPDGAGYWLVAADGGTFAFGAAGFYGSMGGRPLAAPVVSLGATADGAGYWEFAADGGVFAFGDAPYLGGGPSGTRVAFGAPA